MRFLTSVTLAALVGLALGFSPVAPALLVPFLLAHKPALALIVPPMPPSRIEQFVDRGGKGDRLVPLQAEYYGPYCTAVFNAACKII